MADVIVTGEEQPDEHDRELGRSEGIAEVHAAEAGENAQTAEEAAQAALNAAEMNAALAGDVVDTATVSEQAAAVSVEARDAVLVALDGQTKAIESLVAELQAARQQPAPTPTPPPTKSTPPSDKAPARKPKFADRYNQRKGK